MAHQGTTTDPDLDSFPLVAKGRKFQDFTVAQKINHHWGRTLTRADTVAFSTATCAWLPLHLNTEYAHEHGHPDIVVNPMLVLCTVYGPPASLRSSTDSPTTVQSTSIGLTTTSG